MERLLQYFVPKNYQLTLTLDRQQETFVGVVLIKGEVLQKLVKFHAVQQEIKSVEISLDEETYAACPYNYHNDVLEIPADDIAKNQTVIYRIKFAAKLNHNMQGCYLSTYNYNSATQKIITTQFESHYAREAFPCIDEPAAKATFDIVLQVPDLAENDVVLANTPLLKQDNAEFIFKTTPRMSTYLLAWVVGPLKSISTTNQHGVKVTSYCALNQNTSSLEFANEVAARALDYYNERFGIKYPLPKMDQVALPDFEAGAMENWGLVTYRESCMLAEPNAEVDRKLSVALTIIHEFSHQWFGDLVTMAWWDDLWLNESFATIMEYCACQALYPELKPWQDFFTGYCTAALRRDCLPGVQAVKQDVNDPAEIATLFDSAIVYAKGARLVLMLMRLMGEENFYRGVHDYFEKYQYNNTVGDNLWECLQPYAEFDIVALMHVWIAQPGYPVLTREGETWSQQRFLIDGSSDETKWPLPEVKDDMSGHYVVKLSDAEFAEKLANFEQMSDEQKMRLLIDRALLAKARQVPSASLLDILPKFVHENAAVWEILLSIINDLKVFFPHGSAEEDEYRKFLRELIAPRMQEVGTQSQAGETEDAKRLRKILLAIARFARDEKVIAELAAQYQDNHAELDAELRGNIMAAKLLTGEDTLFPKLLQTYPEANDPGIKDDILFTMAQAQTPAHVQTLLQNLNNLDLIRAQDHLFYLIYLLRNPEAREQALDWLYHNWDFIVELTGDKSIEDYPRCAAGYINTRAEADEFYQFFDQYADSPVLKRTLAMAKVSIEAKLALIAQESAAVQEKLKTMGN